MMPKSVEPPNPGSFILRFVWKTNQRNGLRSISTFNIGVDAVKGLKNCSRKRASSFSGLSDMEILLYLPKHSKESLFFQVFLWKEFHFLELFPLGFYLQSKGNNFETFLEVKLDLLSKNFFRSLRMSEDTEMRFSRYWKIFVILCRFSKATRFVTLFLSFLKWGFLEFKALLKALNMEGIT